ncbi:TetR/AcrR family transcriptional regulator [Planotetraspora silvatica]|uniref:TetR/AcrR family transcriptional regulator n=1 Tax=Planotetraspora silvatica TaxID=234614 RepID=UPI0019511CAF|nr:TetR family transcriptional regulator [Planotetraspora silvatica]
MSVGGVRERSKARRRDAITRTAYRLFAERGFAATTIADIAAEADVAPRTVTLYFRSKHDIAFSRFIASTQRLTDALQGRSPKQSALDVLGEWLRAEAAARGDLDDLQRRMFDANPELQALQRAHLADAIQEGTAAIAADVGASPEDVGPRIVAAATLAVMYEVYCSRHDLEQERALEIAFAFLKAGVSALSR